MSLAAVPVVVAGAAVGLATTLTIAFGSDTARYLDLDGLLSYPLGYHNAVAAFFMVCAIPALALLTRDEFQWPLRSALSATVTIAVGPDEPDPEQGSGDRDGRRAARRGPAQPVAARDARLDRRSRWCRRCWSRRCCSTSTTPRPTGSTARATS